MMTAPSNLDDKMRKTGEKIAGCIFLSLVGYDGITIAQYALETKYDNAYFDAEMATLMTAARNIDYDLNLKKQIELIWLTEDAYIITYFIRNDYFLYTVLDPKKANPGLARIELKRLANEIEKIFL